MTGHFTREGSSAMMMGQTEIGRTATAAQPGRSECTMWPTHHSSWSAACSRLTTTSKVDSAYGNPRELGPMPGRQKRSIAFGGTCHPARAKIHFRFDPRREGSPVLQTLFTPPCLFFFLKRFFFINLQSSGYAPNSRLPTQSTSGGTTEAPRGGGGDRPLLHYPQQ